MRKPQFFPPPELADSDGVVAIGGQLSVERLVDAYAHGIFPWPIVNDFEILLWFSPDPRAIFEIETARPPKRLRGKLHRDEFQVTFDHDFAAVIRGCAFAHRHGGTWITPDMIAAYCELHRRGCAHSVEVWQNGELVGGTYGVAIGGLFAAESMFHRVTDASKIALFHLIAKLQERGYQLFDIQQLTPHTQSLGAVEISRRNYLRRLEAAVYLPVTWAEKPQSGLDSGRSE